MPVFNVSKNVPVRSTAHAKGIGNIFYSIANKHFGLDSLFQFYTGVTLAELC